MVATTEDISQKEHLLAEKAQGILEHQQELEYLHQQKEKLQQEKPTTEKEQLSYEESLELGKQMKQYKKKHHRIDLEIQKLTRELNALKLQAKKLIPVSEVKVKVTSENSPSRTFCIELLESSDDSESEVHFRVEQLY